MPVPASRQREALRVLDEHLFADGAFPITPELLSQLKADMVPDWNYPWRYATDYNINARIAGLYDTAFAVLLEPARLTRVLDNERRVAAAERFTLVELFSHLSGTAFTDARPGVDRRALQRVLVQHLTALTSEPKKGTPAEASQLAAATLQEIREIARRWLARKDLDGYTRAHHQDLDRGISRTLDPRWGGNR